MKLSHLHHFQAVCQYHSVTKAAEMLHISQPSVSNSIRELEEEFGVSLFRREKNRLFLTEEGVLFLGYVNEMLDREREILAFMTHLAGQQNKVVVGDVGGLGNFLFPDLIHKFKSLHPEISVQIIESGGAKMKEMLEEDKVDLCALVLEKQEWDSFEQLEVVESRYVLVVSATHPLSGRDRVPFSILEALPMAVLEESYCGGSLFTRILREEGVNVTPAASCRQISTLKSIVRSSDYATVLVEENVRGSAGLALIPFEKPVPVHVGFVWKRRRRRNTASDLFLRFLKSYQYPPSRNGEGTS